MKPGFQLLDVPKLDHHGRVICNQCGKEYPADEMIYARPLIGPGFRGPRWYCSTWDCNASLDHGVYFLTHLS